jgi:hypothetical protein
MLNAAMPTVAAGDAVRPGGSADKACIEVMDARHATAAENFFEEIIGCRLLIK